MKNTLLVLAMAAIAISMTACGSTTQTDADRYVLGSYPGFSIMNVGADDDVHDIFDGHPYLLCGSGGQVRLVSIKISAWGSITGVSEHELVDDIGQAQAAVCGDNAINPNKSAEVISKIRELIKEPTFGAEGAEQQILRIKQTIN